MSKVFGITGQKLADTGGRIKKRYHQMLEEANMIIRGKTVKREKLFDFMGLTISLFLIIFFMIGSLSMRSLLIIGVSLCVWTLWSLWDSLLAFGVILFVWFNVFNRASLFLISVEGYYGRGYIALGNVLLSVFVFAYIFKHIATRRKLTIGRTWSRDIILMLPYLLLSVLLPLLGILSGQAALSYATTSLRTIQWISIGIMSYLLCKEYGHVSVLKMVFSVIVLSSFVEFFYSCLQVYYAYLFPNRVAALYLDRVYIETHAREWLTIHRITGLAVNPNSLGLLGVIFDSLFLSSILSGYKVNPLTLFFVGFSGAWLVVVSASRTALITLICLFVLVFIVGILKQYIFSISSKLVYLAVLLLFVLVGLSIVSHFMPHLTQRILSALSLSGVLSDINFVARVETWKETLSYLETHPFGTLASPFYTIKVGVDNYWVYLLTQGSVLYMLAFILFLSSVLALGAKAIKNDVSISRFAGYFTMLVVFSACVESITMVAFLDPSVIFLMFALIGITAYSRNKATA